MCVVCFFLFFKQKTAYEMRISDWSSDVCSSDLDHQTTVSRLAPGRRGLEMWEDPDALASVAGTLCVDAQRPGAGEHEIKEHEAIKDGRVAAIDDRKSVVEGKSV